MPNLADAVSATPATTVRLRDSLLGSGKETGVRAAAAIIALVVVAALALVAAARLPAGNAPTAARWLADACLVAALFSFAPRVPGRNGFALLAVIAVSAELFAASRNLDVNSPQPAELYTDLRQTEAYLLSDPGTFRVLSIANNSFDSGDKADLVRLFGGQLGATGTDFFLSGTKWKEVLTPNVSLAYHLAGLDGYDGGVLPLARYVQLKSLYVPPCQGCENPDAILRNELSALPGREWLSLLNVKYVIADKLHDAWLHNVYYDLTNSVSTAPGQAPIRLRGFDPTPAIALGLIVAPRCRWVSGGHTHCPRDGDGRIRQYLRIHAARGHRDGGRRCSGCSDPTEVVSTSQGSGGRYGYLAVLDLPFTRWVRRSTWCISHRWGVSGCVALR